MVLFVYPSSSYRNRALHYQLSEKSNIRQYRAGIVLILKILHLYSHSQLIKLGLFLTLKVSKVFILSSVYGLKIVKSLTTL